MRRIIAFLCLVELTSGILQGYYTPILTDIARHLGIHDADVNWFEAAQLTVSALAVPVLAKLGDLYGHRRILLQRRPGLLARRPEGDRDEDEGGDSGELEDGGFAHGP